MPDSLYERDALAWAEQQTTLLRRLATGERVNDAVDWPNVIEELQDVGLSELRACKSLLRQSMLHLLKLHAWPMSMAAAHWRAETRGFLFEAGQAFSPSMRQRIDLTAIHGSALQQARDERDDNGAPRPLPDACPFMIDELLAANVEALERKLDIEA